MSGPNDIKKPAEPNLLENIWSFNYRRGSAPLHGHVRARTAELAFKVAARWCELNGYRTPSGISPLIVADESLLEVKPDQYQVAGAQERVV